MLTFLLMLLYLLSGCTIVQMGGMPGFSQLQVSEDKAVIARRIIEQATGLSCISLRMQRLRLGSA
jgi:hypothetical protein